jgi:hypothetical protein
MAIPGKPGKSQFSDEKSCVFSQRPGTGSSVLYHKNILAEQMPLP